MRQQLLAGLLAATLAACTYAELPTVPGPPDRLPLPTREYYKPAARGLVYQLQPGWNAISVPLKEVKIARGLTHQLLSYQGQFSQVGDPNTDSRSIVSGQGYWVYAEGNQQIEFEGEPVQSGSLELSPGWNLIGCPTSVATALDDPQHLLTESVSSEPASLSQQKNGPASQAELPAAPSTRSLTPTASEVEFRAPTIARPGQILQPKQAYWVHAERSGRLSFGESNKLDSDRQQLRTTIRGTVSDSKGNPIPRARVQLAAAGNPSQVRTDQWGRFQIGEIPANGLGDEVSLTASAENFHPVTVRAKALAKPAPPASESGTGASFPNVSLKLQRYLCQITVSVYSFEYGSSTYRPYKLQIWQSDRYSNRTYQTFWNSTYYRNDFVWSNFPQGKEYTVQFIWQDQHGNQLYQTRRAIANKTLSQMYAYNSWTW